MLWIEFITDDHCNTLFPYLKWVETNIATQRTTRKKHIIRARLFSYTKYGTTYGCHGNLELSFR